MNGAKLREYLLIKLDVILCTHEKAHNKKHWIQDFLKFLDITSLNRGILTRLLSWDLTTAGEFNMRDENTKPLSRTNLSQLMAQPMTG